MCRGFCLLALFLGVMHTASAQEQELTFGLVIDGSSEYLSETVLETMKREITALLGRDYQVRFPEEKTLDSQYSLEQIRTNLETLVQDEDVDVVIGVGVLSCMVASQQGSFEKPVFAPFGIGAELAIYPIKDGASGVRNFNYLMTPAEISRDLLVMQRMRPIKTLHLVTFDLFIEVIPGLIDFVERSFSPFNITAEVVTGSVSADEILAQIPDDTDMVYVTPMLRMTNAERSKMFAGLAERKLLNFSMLGREEVDLGALAGTSPESDVMRWMRRLALNIQRSLLGEDPGSLPVLFKENAKLVINMDSARTIGWFPAWDLQIEAELINEEPEAKGEELTLEMVVQDAVGKNLALRAAGKELDIGREEIKLAQAQRALSVDGNANYLQVDGDSADASLGSQPEHESNVSVTATQVLFAEGINANISIQKSLQRAREAAFEVEKLDVALDASERFLNYLQAKALYRIEKENLELTISNLETAVVRRDVGIGSPAEVFRWEAKLAGDRLNAISARNQADAALYALNQILNQPQERLVNAVPPDRFDPRLRTGLSELGPYVSNSLNFQRFREFMVKEVLGIAPELRQIDAVKEANTRELLSRKRAFWSPTVSLQAQINQELHRASGDGFTLPGVPADAFPEAPENSWSAVLNVSLPLWDGGKRKAELSRTRHASEQVDLQRAATAQAVELRIRAGMQNIATTSIAIQLRQEAEEASRKNLALVDDAYAKGVATSLDLLDAQNALLVAGQAAAVAEYEFFSALMEFQRASGQFDYFISSEERAAFFERLRAHYSQYQ